MFMEKYVGKTPCGPNAVAILMPFLIIGGEFLSVALHASHCLMSSFPDQ
jgi:hypothetical protein